MDPKAFRKRLRGAILTIRQTLGDVRIARDTQLREAFADLDACADLYSDAVRIAEGLLPKDEDMEKLKLFQALKAETGLHLRPGEQSVLWELYLARGGVVRHGALRAFFETRSASENLENMTRVRISKVRKLFRDLGFQDKLVEVQWANGYRATPWLIELFDRLRGEKTT